MRRQRNARLKPTANDGSAVADSCCRLADAVAAYSAAAEMCMDQNRLGPAAKHYKEIGEIYEGEFEFDKAIKALKQALVEPHIEPQFNHI